LHGCWVISLLNHFYNSFSKKHYKLKNPLLKTNFIESTSFVRLLAIVLLVYFKNITSKGMTTMKKSFSKKHYKFKNPMLKTNSIDSTSFVRLFGK
jgi:hypothetical protein